MDLHAQTLAEFERRFAEGEAPRPPAPGSDDRQEPWDSEEHPDGKYEPQDERPILDPEDAELRFDPDEDR